MDWLFALLLAFLVAVGLIAPPTPPPVQPTDCPVSQVVYVPGSSETTPAADPSVPVGILGQVAAKVPALATFTPYPATLLNPLYPVSVQAGITAATAELVATRQHCPLTKFALVGYSQGADVAGDLGSQIANGLTAIPADRLVGVGLIADPKRSPSDPLIGTPVPGTGVLGTRPAGFGSVPVVTFCAPGDVVCSYTGGSPLDAFNAEIHQSYGTIVAELSAWLNARL